MVLAAVAECVVLVQQQRISSFLRGPTILAWDLSALCRILPLEARSP